MCVADVFFLVDRVRVTRRQWRGGGGEIIGPRDGSSAGRRGRREREE